MYGQKYHWMNKSEHLVATTGLFKTLVRLRIVDPIEDHLEWSLWYGAVIRFTRDYEPRK